MRSTFKQVAAQLSSRGLPKAGALLSNFSGSIASGVADFIHSTVARVVASQQVARLWVQGNRLVHQQLVLALEGKKSSITVSNGQVVIGLAPIIDQVKHDLAARGLTIVDKLPPINPTFPLFSAKYLVQAQSLYRLLTTLKWALPVLTLILLAAGVYIARRHRRAALRITAVALAVLVFIFWGTPTGLTVLVIAIVLVVVLGLIELSGRPSARARPAGMAPPGGSSG